MDLIRELLLKIEEKREPSLGDLLPKGDCDDDFERVGEHLRMMIEDAGLVTGIQAHTIGSLNWLELKLTWQGHDFLDSVRDPEIWAKTKSAAEGARGFTFDLFKDLAKGFLKKKIKDLTDVDL
jgi:hypothetical protein